MKNINLKKCNLGENLGQKLKRPKNCKITLEFSV